ncbi:MAG TPA: preprotein translocase subunit YajC [Lentimicrobium sp.]|nr:preprotein translocase subunit YajC [Lentimicrobium sp.]
MLANILLMSPPQGGSGTGSGYSSLIFLALIMVVFYFFFIRPQAKKAKDLKKYRESLKKGDKIITIGGLHGKIVEVQENTFTIEVEDGSKMRFEKSAIASSTADQMTPQA